MKITLITTLFLLSTVTYANFDLAQNGKKITCYADDNQSWEVNKARTTIKYTVEGESLGANKIIDRKTDKRSYITYTTDEGTLRLSNQKDTFQFAEADDAFEVECH